MNANVQTSATIYQFPVGGRKGLNRDQQKPATDLVRPQVAPAAIVGAWYHDAAIQDTKRVSER